ncbi:MAG: hypothetical protein HRU12_08980 [Phaeodactylibacter sp.]|nr:hypothetical protein [Phaeodactylibacter sp.]
MPDLASLAFAVSIGLNQYTDDSGPEPELFVRLDLGLKDEPYYVWAEGGKPTTRLLGQPLDTTVIGGGVGYHFSFTDNVYGLAELGYHVFNLNPTDWIQDEAVFKSLVLNHETVIDPIPVELGAPYDYSTFGTDYTLDDGVSGAFGVGMKFGPHFSTEFRYRILMVEEKMELFDPETRACNGSCGGWWEEVRNRNFSSFQINLRWEF